MRIQATTRHGDYSHDATFYASSFEQFCQHLADGVSGYTYANGETNTHVRKAWDALQRGEKGSHGWTWYEQIPEPTTQEMLSHQLDAVLRHAVEVTDHMDNFDEHKEELEDGTREEDDWLTEDTDDVSDLRIRWEESILSIDKRVQFDFLFCFGGPNVWAEVLCYVEEHEHWTQYDVRTITLRGGWGGDTDTREIHDNHPLWDLIVSTVEGMGESGQ